MYYHCCNNTLVVVGGKKNKTKHRVAPLLMQAAALKVCNVSFPSMETWLFRCCSCSSPVYHWDATLSKKTAVATVLCTPDLISLVSTSLYIQLLGALQSCIYSEFSQWGVTGAMVGTAVHIRRRGGGFSMVANYHAGAVCQCVLLSPTSYKNIIRALRMVVRFIETLFTTLVIWCRPGSSGETSTNRATNQHTKWPASAKDREGEKRNGGKWFTSGPSLRTELCSISDTHGASSGQRTGSATRSPGHPRLEADEMFTNGCERLQGTSLYI